MWRLKATTSPPRASLVCFVSCSCLSWLLLLLILDPSLSRFGACTHFIQLLLARDCEAFLFRFLYDVCSSAGLQQYSSSSTMHGYELRSERFR